MTFKKMFGGTMGFLIAIGCGGSADNGAVSLDATNANEDANDQVVWRRYGERPAT